MSDQITKIVIIGATSAIAEHCARLWLNEARCEVILLGRDLAKTERVAADLRVRGPQSQVSAQLADFADPRAIGSQVDAICAAGPVDIVLIAHGSLPDQAACQADLLANEQAMAVNGLSPVLFAEAFVTHMVRTDRGTLGLIGSVAGDRGRKSNYVYGAAKGLVTRYAQGLQHRLAATNVKVVLIKPGPTDTPMTAHLKQEGGKLASVEQVAQNIVDGMRAGKAVVYAPGKWALIMLIIRHLPNFIFNKMDI
jgi:decaprenylphospho-beta-D-erythro-pentofuranosid-2-ulose 2-reductase